jgi:hypothetical protein
MGKNTIRLNEEQFRQVIEESVKSILNEMDQDVYVRAADKAKELGQHQRAMRFNNHAASIARRKAHEYVADVNRNYITYKTVTGKEWTIGTNSRTDEKNYYYNVNDLTENGVPSSLRTTDVRTAKYVADWCNRYSTNKHDFTKNDFIA